MATGESYHSLRFQYRISVSEISRIIKQTLAVLKEKLVPLFLPNISKEGLEEKSNEYYVKWNFPNCIGTIDGKHVRIRCPMKSSSLYYNYKGFFSIVLLAVVDANYKFMFIDVGSYGKEGDSGIFEKSTLGKAFFNGTLLPPPRRLPNSQLLLPHVLIGDDAFKLHPNMMKPYQKEDALANNIKGTFNYRLCRARRTSENAFGILSQVFRVFYTPINLLPETVDNVIVVSCCLHNMMREGYLSRSGRANYELDPTEALPTENLIPLRATGGYANVKGFTVRSTFASYFVEEGKVSWQESSVHKTDRS